MQGRFVFAAGILSIAAIVGALSRTQSAAPAPIARPAASIAPGAAAAATIAEAVSSMRRAICAARESAEAVPGEARPSVSEDLRLFLDRAQLDDEVDVIVSVRADVDVVTWATQMETRARGSVRVLGGVHAAALRLPAHAVRDLLARRELAHLTRDAQVAASLDHVAPATGVQQVLAAGAVDGTGIVIAVVDSGVAHHVQLDGRILQELDLRSGVSPDVRDLHGHGTHVAGILAGSGVLTASGERRMRGIAPGARIISLKVLGDDGLGKTSDVIAAVEWVAAHARDVNGAQLIHVLNLSAGHPIFESYLTDPLVLACQHAVDAGVVVVTSAGNYGTSQGITLYGGITSPANAPWVIAVGASDGHGTAARADDTVATFSSAGPTVIDGLLSRMSLLPA
ncbi:MAG: S8 family serine peptidase [Planctomycetota bacterium]